MIKLILPPTDLRVLLHHRRCLLFDLRIGNPRLSKDFQAIEFASRCGCPLVIIDPLLVEILQECRDHFGRAVRINSGFRTEYHNERVGGRPNSFHLRGEAADIDVMGVKPKRVADYLETVAGVGGIGRYRTFTHVDTGPEGRRWR